MKEYKNKERRRKITWIKKPVGPPPFFSLFFIYLIISFDRFYFSC